MKKILTLFLSAVLLITNLAACAAEVDNAEDITIILQIDNPVMTVNGAEKPIDAEGTAPVIVNDRTLLPVRAVIEEMGGEATWDGETQTVLLAYNGNIITLAIDNPTAFLNDDAVTLDTAPTIINDRTMLPIRFIAESFEFNVDWNGEEQKVTISNSANNAKVNDNLALVNGGTFQMGSPSDEPERGADETQHSVTVDSFYMSKTELTQKEYQDLMGNNPSENKGDSLPVTNITWYDAIQYCNALSEKEGLTPCYTISGNTVTWNRSADGYRLPTEAEWEYAARANTNTPFSFGDYVQDSDANCYNAYGYNNDASGSWVNGYLGYTVDADSYNANDFGLYNMHGNAAEWVWDWYGEYDTNSMENPTGAESGSYKVARGGAWNDMPKHIRSAYRIAFPADVPLYSIGMRVVRNAVPSNGEIKSVYGAKAEQTTGKTLIAYFSQTGNTDGFAKIIAEMSDADIFRIERKTPYSSSHNGTALYGEALDELRSGNLPELKAYLEDAGLDINQYDTILLGYCNWWASIPAPVSSFLSHYDLSGKTIIPFCSMGGGRFGQGISMIAKLAPDSVIKEGLTVTYSSYDRDEIENWLKKNGIEKLTPMPETGNAKALVAYFSATNNTEGIAKHILDAVDADEYEIIAETPYTSADLNYNTDCRANREQNDASARPAISGGVENMENYDVIFLGYPIWWGQAPKIIYTFLESYDFSGKTIVPFCTSASSGVGNSATNLHNLAPNAAWHNGTRFSAGASRSSIASWINGLGLDITTE